MSIVGPAQTAAPNGWPVLRRDRRIGDKPFVFWFFLQGVEEELRRAFERRVNAF